MSDQIRPGTGVLLIRGSDEVLVGDAVRSAVKVLLDGEDPALASEELSADSLVNSSGSPSLSPLVDAAQTPPFLGALRVVVGRGLGAFTTAAAVEPLVSYLRDPLPTTRLVLVWERGGEAQRGSRVPKALTDAVSAAGGVTVDVSPRKVSAWVQDQLGAAPLRFHSTAVERIAEHVGEEPALLSGVVQTLVGTYGEGAALGLDDVEPYLLEGGGALAPWALTDAIDSGSVSDALGVLSRTLGAGGRHPLQVMATLGNHYNRILALDGANVTDEKAAASLLGMKGSTFPARKALTQTRRLGSGRIREIAAMLARADLDLRGARAWPPELVMEVLVARLAARSGRGRSS